VPFRRGNRPARATVCFRDLREACVFRVDEDLLDYEVSETETAVRLDVDSASVSGSAPLAAGMIQVPDSHVDIRIECLRHAASAVTSTAWVRASRPRFPPYLFRLIEVCYLYRMRRPQ
jgi:hypothetical protein